MILFLTVSDSICVSERHKDTPTIIGTSTFANKRTSEAATAKIFKKNNEIIIWTSSLTFLIGIYEILHRFMSVLNNSVPIPLENYIATAKTYQFFKSNVFYLKIKIKKLNKINITEISQTKK